MAVGAALLVAACLEVPELAEPGPVALPVIAEDPPLDRVRSPYTGWTRTHHVALFARTLAGFVDHLAEGGARTTFSGSPEDTPGAIEGVTRMLEGLGYWLNNPVNPSRFEYRGRVFDAAAIARTALVHGTDPAHAEYWGPIARGNQRVIEAGLVAQFLIRSKERVWDTLAADERDRVMAWLAASDDGYPDNWTCAELHRNLARKLLGYPYDAAALAGQLARVLAMYVGDGWYSDGAPGRFDYYNAFVIHPDLLAWAGWDGAADPAARAEVRGRAAAFVHHFPYFFDSGGAHVFFGRSLAYRSAVTAAVQAAEVHGVSPLPPGQARRLVSGSLAMFVGDDLLGAERMFDADDAIRSGYLAEDPGILEAYQREGSQYFFVRAFAGLQLGPEHAYWSAPEHALPADAGPFVHTITAPGFVLRRGPGVDAPVTLLSTRADREGPDYVDKYRRLQYASRSYFQRAFTPPFPRDGLVTAAADEGFVAPRGPPEGGAVGPGFAYVRYTAQPESPVWSGSHSLGVASFVVGDGLVRVACVTPWTGEPTRLHEGGFAVETAAQATKLAWAGPAIVVRTDARSDLLAGLFGYAEAAIDREFEDAPGYNAILRRGAYPTLRGGPAVFGSSCAGSLQVTRLGGLDPGLYEHLVAGVEGDDPAQTWTLRLADGSTIWTSLAAEVEERAVELGGLRFAGPLRAVTAHADGRGWTAVGVRSVARGADGGLVLATDPAARLQANAVAWAEDPAGRLQVTLGAPATIYLPTAWLQAAVHHGGLGDHATFGAGEAVDGVYEVDADRFAAATGALRLESATFTFVAP